MAESNSWNNGLNQGQNRGFSGNGSISGASGTAIRDAIFDRVPPHDDAAEMAVLGGMLRAAGRSCLNLGSEELPLDYAAYAARVMDTVLRTVARENVPEEHVQQI